jgi:hypothetical protein
MARPRPSRVYRPEEAKEEEDAGAARGAARGVARGEGGRGGRGDLRGGGGGVGEAAVWGGRRRSLNRLFKAILFRAWERSLGVVVLVV